MATKTTVKVMRPNRLTENETLTPFEDRRITLEFHLQQDGDFIKFPEADASWKVVGENIIHRGLAEAEAARRTFTPIFRGYSKFIFATSSRRYC